MTCGGRLIPLRNLLSELTEPAPPGLRTPAHDPSSCTHTPSSSPSPDTTDPGVTSALFAALAAHDVEVLDVEQVVISDRLVLGVVLALHGDPAPLRRAVTHAAEALGTEVDVSITEDPDEIGSRMPVRHHVMVLGRPLRAGAVGEMARRISDLGGNIHSIVRLTHRPVTVLEIVVSGVDPARLGGGLVRGRGRGRGGRRDGAGRPAAAGQAAAAARPGHRADRAEPLAALADQVGRGAESRRAAGRRGGGRPVHRRRGPGPGGAAGRRAGELPGRRCAGGCSGRTGRAR